MDRGRGNEGDGKVIRRTGDKKGILGTGNGHTRVCC